MSRAELPAGEQLTEPNRHHFQYFPEVLRSSSYMCRKPSGVFETWLVGFDELWRGVYWDEKHGNVLTIVPEDCNYFNEALWNRAQNYQKPDSRLNPVRGPEGVTFVVVDKTPLKANLTEHLLQYIVGNCGIWDGVSEWHHVTEDVRGLAEKHLCFPDGPCEEDLEALADFGSSSTQHLDLGTPVGERRY
jgi:hypothetical protein